MSSGGGDSTTITKSEPPDYAKPYNEAFLQRGSDLSNAAYQPYTGDRVADTNAAQNLAYGAAQNLAVNGNSSLNAANDYLKNSIYDNYLLQGQSIAGQGNPYEGARTRVGTNQYLGLNNPYLEQAIGNAQNDMVQSYNMTTRPMFASQNRASGAYGNSGIQQMQQKSLSDLTQNIGRVSNDMRMADYGNQLNLAESGINRQMQADQGDLARNAALSTDSINRQLNAFQAERGNQLQAMGMAPSLAGADWNTVNNLYNLGKDWREIGQQDLNAQYDAWTQQTEAPLKNLDILSKTISGSMGGGNTFTTQPTNMAANLMGLGLGGYGLMSTAGLLGGG